MPIPTGDSMKSAPRTLLRDTVASSLRSAIMSGDLHPGERLNDEELRGWLGVSRTPIRDAVNELSRCGLLETAPNRYTRVASPTSQDASDALSVIGLLVVSSLKLCVNNFNEEDKKYCQQIIDRAKIQFDTDDGLNLGQTCIDLLSQVSEHLKNEQLERIISDRIWALGFYVTAAFIKEKTPEGFLPLLKEASEALSEKQHDAARVVA